MAASLMGHGDRKGSVRGFDRLLAVLLLVLAILAPVDVVTHPGAELRPASVIAAVTGVEPFTPSVSLAEMTDELSDGEHAFREPRTLSVAKTGSSFPQMGAIPMPSLRLWLPERPPRTA